MLLEEIERDNRIMIYMSPWYIWKSPASTLVLFFLRKSLRSEQWDLSPADALNFWGDRILVVNNYQTISHDLIIVNYPVYRWFFPSYDTSSVFIPNVFIVSSHSLSLTDHKHTLIIGSHTRKSATVHQETPRNYKDVFKTSFWCLKTSSRCFKWPKSSWQMF
jgi:hypothetical protein